MPLPVSFKGIEFSDMLKVEVLEPNPRFIHTYVNEWWKWITSEPPIMGHRVRLFADSVWLTLAPRIIIHIGFYLVMSARPNKTTSPAREYVLRRGRNRRVTPPVRVV